MSNRVPMTTMLLLLGAFASGCSGGSDGGVAGAVLGDPDVVGGGGGDSTLLTPTFTADQPSPGPDTVALESLVALGDAVTVGVNVTDTSNIASASFELSFDPDKMEFVDSSCGDALPPCGSGTLAQVTPFPGRLVIGLAQVGVGPGVDVTGTATLIRLTFRAIAPGVSRLDFDPVRTALGDPDLEDIPGIQWYGGSILAD